jgi:hypothetical protein
MTNLWELDLRGNPLNVEAYCTYLPLIKANNRRFGNRPLWYDSIELSYDPNPNPEDCDSCAMEQVYGESSEETELLRYFRDHVLSQTPEGRQIIRLYYQWSPVIVRRMEQDEEFRSQVKKIIDGILPFIRARTE